MENQNADEAEDVDKVTEAKQGQEFIFPEFAMVWNIFSVMVNKVKWYSLQCTILTGSQISDFQVIEIS